VPRLCEFYPGICLKTEEKSRKNLSEGKKNLSQVKKNLSHSTVYILPKTPTPTSRKNVTSTALIFSLFLSFLVDVVGGKNLNQLKRTALK
jgi:hypothetical protein